MSGRFRDPEFIGASAFSVLLSCGIAFEVPICPFRLCFGVSCPGCGLTRGSLALLEGDWEHMFLCHPLTPILLPMVAIILLWALLKPYHNKRLGVLYSKLGSAGALILLFLILGVWILRLTGVYGTLPEPFPPQDGLLFHLFSAVADGCA